MPSTLPIDADDRAMQIQDDRRDHAERELAAYFTGETDERRHAGWRAGVETVLAAIPVHRRAVLSLHHSTREWPEAIRKKFGPLASLAIRLDCCDHPTLGTKAAAEAAAVERLVALIADEEGTSHAASELSSRASRHLWNATEAYVNARRKHEKARAKENAARAKAERAARARLADAAE